MTVATHLPSDCRQARQAMHARLDGGLVDVAAQQRLDGHLERCSECRDHWVALERMQRSLRDLPTAPMPDDALAEVFARTRGTSAGPATTWVSGRGIAAAAVLVLSLLGAWALWPVAVQAPSEIAAVDRDGDDGAAETFTAEEREEAIRQTRLALGLAAHALDHAQQVSVRQFEEILNEDLSPALERLPVKLPEPSSEGRSQT